MAMVRLTENGYLNPLSINREVGTASFFRAICGAKSPWTITRLTELAVIAPTDRVFIFPAIGNIEQSYVASGGQGVESWVPHWSLTMPKTEEEIESVYSLNGAKAAHVFWGRVRELPDTSTIKQVVFSGIHFQLFVMFGVLSCVWFPHFAMQAYPAGKDYLSGRSGDFPGAVAPIRGIWKVTDSMYGVRYLSDNVEVMEVVWSS